MWEHPYCNYDPGQGSPLSLESKTLGPVPYYYVPEKDVAAGPAKIEKDKEDKHGFWLGTIRSGSRSAEAQGYDQGPLQGFIKIKVSDIGQLLHTLALVKF